MLFADFKSEYMGKVQKKNHAILDLTQKQIYLTYFLTYIWVSF